VTGEATRANLDAYLWSVLRIVIGILFATHGMQKLFGLWGVDPSKLPLQLKVGGGIELVGGLLFAVGLATRAAAFLMSGQMAVAYFQFHVATTGEILPILNKGEDTVLYCFFFLYAVVRGPGPLSLDRRLGVKIIWPA
jgi:putative oxidoreductase